MRKATEPQKALAKAISETLEIPLPDDDSILAYSDFISLNVTAYRVETGYWKAKHLEDPLRKGMHELYGVIEEITEALKADRFTDEEEEILKELLDLTQRWTAEAQKIDARKWTRKKEKNESK